MLKFKSGFWRTKYPQTKGVRELAIARVMLFFVLPIVLLYFGIVPIEGRMLMLLVFSVLIYGSIKNDGWVASDLGLTRKTIKSMWKPYTVATLIALVLVVVFAESLGMSGTERWWVNPHFLFLFLFVSVFQEFAFRGFLMPILSQIFPDGLTIVIINSLLFAGMHAIYPFPHIGLPFSFVAGIFFASLYRRYPNLILVSLSHAVLNFAVVWYGFFNI